MFKRELHCLQGCFRKQTVSSVKFVNAKRTDRASVCNESLSLTLLVCLAEICKQCDYF